MHESAKRRLFSSRWLALHSRHRQTVGTLDFTSAGQSGKQIFFLSARNSALCVVHPSVHLFFYPNAATVHPSCLTVKMEHKLDKLAVYRTATEKDRQQVTLTPMTPEAIQNQLALHGSLCMVGGASKAAWTQGECANPTHKGTKPGNRTLNLMKQQTLQWSQGVKPN